MKNIVIVASPDRGKSFFTKNELLKKFTVSKLANGKMIKRRNFILDWNSEYTEFKNSFTGNNDKDTFMNEVILKTSADNSCCNVVFEEATMFIRDVGVPDGRIMNLLSRRFHTKNLNIFIFHLIKKINIDILGMTDFLIILRTEDKPEAIYKKFSDYPKIIEAYEDVKEKTENTFFNRETKTYPDERSKNNFHYKRILTKPY